MYELHGWVSIVATSLQGGDGEDEEVLREAAVAALKERIKSLGSENPEIRIFVLNGWHQLTIQGLLNHSGPAAAKAEEIFKYAGVVAPGSYGLLYVRDDGAAGAERDKFVVHVMRRGRVTNQADPFFSPCSLTID